MWWIDSLSSPQSNFVVTPLSRLETLIQPTNAQSSDRGGRDDFLMLFDTLTGLFHVTSKTSRRLNRIPLYESVRRFIGSYSRDWRNRWLGPVRSYTRWCKPNFLRYNERRAVTSIMHWFIYVDQAAYSDFLGPSEPVDPSYDPTDTSGLIADNQLEDACLPKDSLPPKDGSQLKIPNLLDWGLDQKSSPVDLGALCPDAEYKIPLCCSGSFNGRSAGLCVECMFAITSNFNCSPAQSRVKSENTNADRSTVYECRWSSSLGLPAL